MSLYLGENLISGQTTLVGESHNIGQIILSAIPLTDAGLHLLDGALIQGDGIYSAFVDYIAGLVSTYPDLFITESDWQSSVSTYGVCGKFVYDGTNNTVRLPKITGIIEGTTDVNALGDLVEAGLPNITGSVNTLGANLENLTGAFSCSDKSSKNRDDVLDHYGYRKLSFDASLSSSIYGNSSTVQPQTIKAFYYIVIATSTKTDIQVDIDEIATDLNSKADVDLTNCTKPHIIETYVNGTSWYRVYSDGWCEQGGILYSGEDVDLTVTFLKPYKNTNYIVDVQTENTAKNQYNNGINVGSKTSQGFVMYIYTGGGNRAWQASGYIN